MNSAHFLVVISAVVIIVLLWLVIGKKHLKHLQGVVRDEWEKVDERLRKRHNLVPNLVETVRWYDQNQDEMLGEMVAVRMKAAKEYGVSGAKLEYEHELSRVINKVIDFGAVLKDLSLDTNFLELRKEIDELEKEIEERVVKYNEIVREYNKEREKAWLSPICSIFGFKTENIFETEI